MTSFSSLLPGQQEVEEEEDSLSLPPWLQAIAESEVREPSTREGKFAAIAELRQQLSFSPPSPDERSRDTSDANLLRWLRAAKFDQTKALEKMKAHERFYATHAEALAGLHAAPKNGEFQSFSKFLQLVRDIEGLQGRVVVCLCPKKAVSRMSKEHIASHPHLLLRFNVWMLERLAIDVQIQICGFILLNSFHALTYYEGWTLQSIVSISERRIVLGFFSVLGFRLQAALIFEEPLVINWIFGVLRQFMSSKLRDRLTLNGSRYEILDALLPTGARLRLPEPFRSGGKAGFGSEVEMDSSEGWVEAQIRLETEASNRSTRES